MIADKPRYLDLRLTDVVLGKPRCKGAFEAILALQVEKVNPKCSQSVA